MERLRARYGPPIQERLELFKRQELEPALRHEISRSYREATQIKAEKAKASRAPVRQATNGIDGFDPGP